MYSCSDSCSDSFWFFPPTATSSLDAPELASRSDEYPKFHVNRRNYPIGVNTHVYPGGYRNYDSICYLEILWRKTMMLIKLFTVTSVIRTQHWGVRATY